MHNLLTEASPCDVLEEEEEEEKACFAIIALLLHSVKICFFILSYSHCHMFLWQPRQPSVGD